MAQIFIPSGEWNPYAYEKIPVSTTAIGPTAATITQSDGQNPVRARRARAVLLSIDATNGLRYRIDGGNPTATDGHELLGSDEVLIEGVESVRKLKMIRTGGADAVAHLTYFRTA